MINEQRLWSRLEALAKIGANADGSITRWPFTKEDKQAELLLIQWIKQASIHVEVDCVGNVIATYFGSDVSLAPIVCGSHFDTVKNGGMFDGCLGVIAGIEVITSMKENGFVPKRTIKVIGFKDEEGNRFGYGMIGSRSIAGVFDEQAFHSKDDCGISLLEAMQQSGYLPLQYKQCQLYPHAMYELHIEQAKGLEDKNIPIAIVDGIAGILRYQVTMHGESAHAGATPMAFRSDPVVAMSEWICHMDKWAKLNEPLVLTIGSISTFPGACNVICDHVSFSLDIRTIDEVQLKKIETEMNILNIQIQKKYGVQVALCKEDYVPACLCDSTRKAEITSICEQMNIPYTTIMSGAGHDSMNFKDICPVSMIFVRSKGGYSHRKEEYTTLADCKIGTTILYNILRKDSLE